MFRRVNKNIIFDHNNYVINERREIDLGILHYIPYNQVERYVKHIEKYKPYRIEIICNDKKKYSLAIKNFPRNLFEEITNNYPVRINSKLRLPLNTIGVTLYHEIYNSSWEIGIDKNGNIYGTDNGYATNHGYKYKKIDSWDDTDSFIKWL